MKKTILLSRVLYLCFCITACKPALQTALEQKFSYTHRLAHHRKDKLFTIFNQPLSQEEKHDLKFLYAYMPLSDLADYDGEFYLKQVRSTIESKNTMPWAASIPMDIFERFVLPLRVNNENLDSSRTVLFHELKNRVKGLSMKDAANEINHWCHEKVEYRAADGRTSSPLATMKSAFGRCGEESTFVVAAMRAVCIPARQVYTPRWAHSDDNHAWVEVWADGEWYFLGGCEPEPVLNLGWFNESASRAMLIHARVYGEHQAKEEVNVSTLQYDDINVTSRYANTFKQTIKVLDKNGKAVSGAKVEYQLYNYAEFYPITTKTTDTNGCSYLTTGYGDLLVWANTKDAYGFEKVSVGKKDTMTIILSSPVFDNSHLELMPPPPSDRLRVALSDKQVNDNKIRLQREDSIRNAYVLSFGLKAKLPDGSGVEKLIKDSRGNYDEIIRFIHQNKGNEWVLPLLNVLAEKDRRDTKASVLQDHLDYAVAYAKAYSPEIFSAYILNPRVDLEMLVPYRRFLIEKFGANFIQQVKTDPQRLINWIKDSIQINNEAQAYNLAISPIGVYEMRISDSRSRNIFFVACCRSFGIPARFEPGTDTPQYLWNQQWMDVFFDGKPAQYEKFDIRFKVADSNLKFTPQYYHHFTLAYFEHNRFNTLDFGEYEDLDKVPPLHVRSGLYRLITSNRLPSGKILVDFKYYTITKDSLISLHFPQDEADLAVQGSMDRKKLNALIDNKDKNACTLDESKNIVVAIIQPDKEPTKHILSDIQKIKRDLEPIQPNFVFIIQKKDLPATFKPEDYPDLPRKTIFKLVDENPQDLLDIQIKDASESYPKVMIVNPKGKIIFHSEGYKIGIGNDILKML